MEICFIFSARDIIIVKFYEIALKNSKILFVPITPAKNIPYSLD